MRLHRFYVKQPLGEELVVEKEGVSAHLLHQWLSVFRYASGDEVILFSPTDQQDYVYTIESISKSEARLRLLSTQNQKNISKDATLYMALVKKDTFETIVRQATELGVSRIIPVLAERSEKKNLNFERLETIALEATEQCGRGAPPFIAPIVSFKEALEQADASMPHLFADLQGERMSGGNIPDGKTALWIGPEGGWSEEERALAKERNFTGVSLTDTVLKAETAAISLLSFVLLS